MTDTLNPNLVHRLAELLASYEMDEPHVEDPPGKGHYPPWTWAEIEGHLQAEHQGDCTGLPSPCLRCFAEAIVHKARWIAGRMGPIMPKGTYLLTAEILDPPEPIRKKPR